MQQRSRIGSVGFLFDLAALFASYAAALSYLVIQWKTNGIIPDQLFVELLLVATTFLVIALLYTRQRAVEGGYAYWAYILSDPDHIRNAHNRLLRRFFSSASRILCGIAYGGLLVFFVNSLGLIDLNGELQYTFFAFLFFANYITGATIYSLISLLTATPALVRNMRIDIWQVRNPATDFFFGIILRVGVFASIYVGLSMTSIIFSQIPVDDLVFLYIVFSFSIVTASILVPYTLYSRRVRDTKHEILARVSSELTSITNTILSPVQTDQEPSKLTRLQELAQLRSLIDQISPIPFQTRAISAGITILAASAQPLIAGLILRVI